MTLSFFLFQSSWVKQVVSGNPELNPSCRILFQGDFRWISTGLRNLFHLTLCLENRSHCTKNDVSLNVRHYGHNQLNQAFLRMHTAAPACVPAENQMVKFVEQSYCGAKLLQKFSQGEIRLSCEVYAISVTVLLKWSCFFHSNRTCFVWNWNFNFGMRRYIINIFPLQKILKKKTAVQNVCNLGNRL